MPGAKNKDQRHVSYFSVSQASTGKAVKDTCPTGLAGFLVISLWSGT